MPIWRDPALIAPEDATAHRRTRERRTALHREHRRDASASRRDYVQPAFEDPAERMLKEGELPDEHRSDQSQDRRPARARAHHARVRAPSRRARRLCAAGAALDRASRRPAGSAKSWRLRRGRLFLVPGDSPIGFRLPLNRCPISSRSITRIWCRPIRSSERGDRCPIRARWRTAVASAARRGTLRAIARDAAAAARRRRTAPAGRHAASRCAPRSTVEPRDGRLCVFMPPVERLEDYLELLAAVEATAAELGHAGACRRLRAAARPAPERHQGDARSRRHRGQCPSGRRAGARRSTSRAALYEDARLSRLGTDKFMIDGRHTGTGGGNHVVLGGLERGRQPVPAPARSAQEPGPLLAAASVAVLSCSPACSSARPARRRASTKRGRTMLYELEIALAMVPAPGAGEAPPPWLVDRLFRNLLVDVTGNTHRAEICIDKLFSPDGPTGRLGLVEFRSFEMPPDARMSLAQQLLLRALDRLVLARAAATARWCAGARRCTTASCSAFRVGGFPRRAGRSARAPAIHSIRNGFDAQREFRFPFYGAVQHGGVQSRAAARARALARAGRGGDRRRHRALRRFLGRAAAGEGRGPQCGPPRRDLQRTPPAADRDRPLRRVRRRRSLQGLEAAAGAASDHRRACAAHLRHLSIAGTRARSAAASTTSPIRADATTRPSRSTPTRRRRGAWRASRITAIRPDSFEIPREERSLEYPMTLDLRRPTQV